MKVTPALAVREVTAKITEIIKSALTGAFSVSDA
jgi:hypothetical protein